MTEGPLETPVEFYKCIVLLLDKKLTNIVINFKIKYQ